MAKTKYVAGRRTTFGRPDPDAPDGPQIVEVFEPGDPVPGAEDFPTLEGLMLQGHLVLASEYEKGKTYHYDDATNTTVAVQIEMAESGE
jgi:hypothetical protein